MNLWFRLLMNVYFWYCRNFLDILFGLIIIGNLLYDNRMMWLFVEMIKIEVKDSEYFEI